MTLKLLDDQVLIRRAPPETVSAGGVVLPDRDVPLPLRGTVLAVGPGRPPECACGCPAPMTVRVGDEVLHARYAGTDLEVDGAPCLVLREREIFGVLSP